LEKLGDVSLTAGQGGLQSKASTLLKALCDEFNDLQSVDKLANVQAKVDGVRTVMQSNIQSALKNTDKIEDIDEKAVVLADSANKFKSASTGLKRNMRWRYIRMIGIFVLLAAAVLAVIIVRQRAAAATAAGQQLEGRNQSQLLPRCHAAVCAAVCFHSLARCALPSHRPQVPIVISNQKKR